MASGQSDNTNDFLNALSFEKPDHIKLEIEKNNIRKRRRVLKKSAESLEDRIRRLVAEHRAVKMKITLADGQLRYIQEQMDGPKAVPLQTDQPPKAVPLQTDQPPKAVPMQTDQSCNDTTLMVRITDINVNHLACFIIHNIKLYIVWKHLVGRFDGFLNLGSSLF